MSCPSSEVSLYGCVVTVLEKERGWDQQWREERQRRGRGRDWRGGRNWRASRNGEKGPPPTGEGEEGGEENEQGNSRLQSSLIDPREVPRKGLFYEVYKDITVIFGWHLVWHVCLSRSHLAVINVGDYQPHLLVAYLKFADIIFGEP